MPKEKTNPSLSRLLIKFLETDPRPTLIASLEGPELLWENEAYRTLRTRADPENSVDDLLNELFVRESGTFDGGLWMFKSMDIGVEGIRAIVATRIHNLPDISLPDWEGPRPSPSDDFQGNVGVQVEMQPRKHGTGERDEKLMNGGFGVMGSLRKELVDSVRVDFEDGEEEEVVSRGGDFELGGTVVKASDPDRDKLSSVPIFAVPEPEPACNKLYPQLTGPSMDWIRNPLYRSSTQHLRNLGNVKWYEFPLKYVPSNTFLGLLRFVALLMGGQALYAHGQTPSWLCLTLPRYIGARRIWSCIMINGPR